MHAACWSLSFARCHCAVLVCLLHAGCCLFACCTLSVARCTLSVVSSPRRMLRAARALLIAVCCPLHEVSPLHVACRLLRVACRSVVCSSLHIVRCTARGVCVLSAAWRLPSVACRLVVARCRAVVLLLSIRCCIVHNIPGPLLIVRCMLLRVFFACCLFSVRGSPGTCAHMSVACCNAVRHVDRVAWRLLHVACCLLLDACCPLHRCMLHAAWCTLHVV